MRSTLARTLSAFLALALVIPAIGEAKGFGRNGGKKSSSSSSSSSSSESSGGSSSGGFGRGGSSSSSSAPTGRWRSSAGSYRTSYSSADSGIYVGSRASYYDPYYHPYYSSWGVYPYGYYAYGYYPYWGAPPIAHAPSAPSDTSFSLHVSGMAAMGTLLPGMSLGVDGERWGFQAQGLVLGSEAPDGLLDPMPFFSAHLTYSLIADPHARVRFEMGATGIVAPDFSYYGPDLGASAQLAIAGPLALEGSAHLTPYPAKVLDLEAGIGLHFGGLGLKFGYRVLRLDDTDINAGTPDGGVDLINGWTGGVGVVF